MLTSVAGVAQQPPVFQAGTTSSFMIFLRGTPVGVEQMAVSRTTEGWSILSTGRMAAPHAAQPDRRAVLPARAAPDQR